MLRPTIFAGLIVLALAGCSSTQDVLDPSAIQQPPQPTNVAAPDTAPLPSAAPPAQPASPNGAQSAAANNAALADARLQFAPVVGPTVDAATILSERLVARSREKGIGLVRAGGPAPSHLVRGYFSALKEGPEVTVIYVWDVYDPAGNRVHRISGQEKARAGSGEGWAAVPADTMRTVADVTVDGLAGWLAGRKG